MICFEVPEILAGLNFSPCTQIQTIAPIDVLESEIKYISTEVFVHYKMSCSFGLVYEAHKVLALEL